MQSLLNKIKQHVVAASRYHDSYTPLSNKQDARKQRRHRKSIKQQVQQADLQQVQTNDQYRVFYMDRIRDCQDLLTFAHKDLLVKSYYETEFANRAVQLHFSKDYFHIVLTIAKTVFTFCEFEYHIVKQQELHIIGKTFTVFCLTFETLSMSSCITMQLAAPDESALAHELQHMITLHHMLSLALQQ